MLYGRERCELQSLLAYIFVRKLPGGHSQNNRYPTLSEYFTEAAPSLTLWKVRIQRAPFVGWLVVLQYSEVIRCRCVRRLLGSRLRYLYIFSLETEHYQTIAIRTGMFCTRMYLLHLRLYNKDRHVGWKQCASSLPHPHIIRRRDDLTCAHRISLDW